MSAFWNVLFWGAAAAFNVASTPPMGFNTWNLYHCAVSAQVLNDTAASMVSSGLAVAGYQYVNSDDCWMNAARDSNGNQVPQPSKFPDGFKPVADYIHSLGLKSGLYTAKGPNTCAGFAASCQHEAQDAIQWASWGIDYVKDDSCSNCRKNDTLDYGTMWNAIEAAGRPMVLTVEGDPIDSIITLGGYGNAKRVGHDISPNWLSMTSLTDIGAGLWMFAHNSTGYEKFGGWWNDLDMIEVGNGPDFVCGDDAASLARCQAHFTQWTIMKAPLILGNDIPHISADTLAVLSNKDAISVNQDSLGIQAQRVNVANNSLASSFSLADVRNTAVLARCDSSRSTQSWSLHADGTLRTSTAASSHTVPLCLSSSHAAMHEGAWVGMECGRDSAQFKAVQLGGGKVALQTVLGGRLTWNNGRYATGPHPFTRYLHAVTGDEAEKEVLAGGAQWVMEGGRLQAADTHSIRGENNVGGRASVGGEYCVDILSAGLLETWAGPLTGGAWAVSLFNRSPAAAPITAAWAMFNVSSTATFKVRDVWAGADLGPFTGSYTATVASEAVAYLILTPA